MRTLSLLVRCWRVRGDTAMRLQVERLDGGQVGLSSGSFLVRVAMDEERLVNRCLIRHIASGREAYIQGGANLSAFVSDCLLQDDPADAAGG
jgi:hypothetical protein